MILTDEKLALLIVTNYDRVHYDDPDELISALLFRLDALLRATAPPLCAHCWHWKEQSGAVGFYNETCCYCGRVETRAPPPQVMQTTTPKHGPFLP